MRDRVKVEYLDCVPKLYSGRRLVHIYASIPARIICTVESVPPG